MDIVQAAKSRYSTKVFDPTRKLPQEKKSTQLKS